MHKGNEYNERRKELRLSCKELSLLSGVPLRTIEDILSGRSKSPRIGAMEALERVLYPLEDVPLTEEEWELVGLYRGMNERQRDLAVRIMKEIMS